MPGHRTRPPGLTPSREPPKRGAALVIDRLLQSAATGEPLLLPNTRKPIISIEGVHAVIRHGLWPDVLREIAALDAVHIGAQIAFVDAWKRMQFRTGMKGVDDDLFYAGLRKMLPAYEGDERTLYRGQTPDELAGMSWTTQKFIALRFALYEYGNPDEGGPYRGNVVLTAIVPPSAIICNIHDWVRRGGEGEVLIDPRGIAYTSEPAHPEDMQ